MLKFVVVSAIFLMPCTYPYGALLWSTLLVALPKLGSRPRARGLFNGPNCA